jgi:hypothetical protein
VTATGAEVRAEVEAKLAQLEPRITQDTRNSTLIAQSRLKWAEQQVAIGERAVERATTEGPAAQRYAAEQLRQAQLLVADNTRAVEAELAKGPEHFVRLSDVQRVEREVLEARGVKFAGEGSLEWIDNASPAYKVPSINDATAARLAEAGTRYPQEWIDASNSMTHPRLATAELPPGDVYGDAGRSAYWENTGTIGFSAGDKSLETATHELAHRLEHANPALVRAEHTFFEWRARGGSWTAAREKAKVLYRAKKGRPSEKAIPDKWATRYMGKEYPERLGSDKLGAYELLSQTMGEMTQNPDMLVSRESLRSGHVGNVREDRELMAWLYGVMVHVR